MTQTQYRALIVREADDGTFHRQIQQCDVADLPAGELTVRVSHSSLNYKDALSATGNRGVTRKFPHQPGIDAVGTVVDSDTADFSSGDEVIVGGRDLGMNTPGGFGEYIRVPADWAIPLPAGLSHRDAMAFGTAGFTAAMAVEEVLQMAAPAASPASPAVSPADGEILVTGASGGVGSIAVAILAKLGFSVCAVTGKPEAHEQLYRLGASRIIDRETATKNVHKPMLSATWAGAVDSVGGTILAAAVKAARPGAVVAACGNAASIELPLTVFPFILRGVRLIGIDSPTCPNTRRTALWEALAGPWRPAQLSEIARDVALDDLDQEITRMLAGGSNGRVVVTHRTG